jgi:hypothetical protein
MKSALLVLALAVLSSVGCRAMNPKCGQPTCSDACVDGSGSCGQPCHLAIRDNAPRPGGCAEGCADGSCSRGGNMEGNCPGGNGCCFDRYTGQNCGPGYPNGQYDCSPCGSPNWGCNGYRHPHGYVDNHACICANGQQCGQQQCKQCEHCGRTYNYCCSGPAPGCCCCPFCGCGPSGDQNYNFNPGPPVAQTAYPYYTLRGPRDFLLANPPSIGPY